MRWLLAVICVALVGCEDRELKELERAKEQACDCSAHLQELEGKGPIAPEDRASALACADSALKDVKAISGSDEPTHRTQRIARDMLDCVAKIYAAQRPDAEDATSPGKTGHASAETP
jgi:hypothetical protein